MTKVEQRNQVVTDRVEDEHRLPEIIHAIMTEDHNIAHLIEKITDALLNSLYYKKVSRKTTFTTTKPPFQNHVKELCNYTNI